MRVLYAYNQHRGGGGADNATRATIDAAQQSGIEVEVFTRSSEALAPRLSGRIIAATSAIYPPDAVRQFGKVLDRFAPDLVHVHELFPMISPWILPLCTRRGIPVVMTCVDYRMTCPIVTHLYKGELCTRCADSGEHWAILRNCRGNMPESVTVAAYNSMVRILKLFRKHVKRFIAPSTFAREWMVRHASIDPHAISTLSPVVTIPSTPTSAAGEYAAFAGRIAPEKGIETLIEAARQSGVPLVLSRHEGSLVRAEVPPEFNVVVTSNRAELDDFYRNARFLVLPSIFFETFGLVGAEAMSHGVPVIATRLGAMSSLVEDGVDGLLFERANAGDLAAKMTTLWDNPALCRRMGAAGRAKALAQWGPDKHALGLRSIYERALYDSRSATMAHNGNRQAVFGNVAD